MLSIPQGTPVLMEELEIMTCSKVHQPWCCFFYSFLCTPLSFNIFKMVCDHLFVHKKKKKTSLSTCIFSSEHWGTGSEQLDKRLNRNPLRGGFENDTKNTTENDLDDKNSWNKVLLHFNRKDNNSVNICSKQDYSSVWYSKCFRTLVFIGKWHYLQWVLHKLHTQLSN